MIPGPPGPDRAPGPPGSPRLLERAGRRARGQPGPAVRTATAAAARRWCRSRSRVPATDCQSERAPAWPAGVTVAARRRGGTRGRGHRAVGLSA